MFSGRILNLFLAALTFYCGAGLSSAAQKPSSDSKGMEFFEKRIRPVLVAECYECHSGDKSKGGLRLDSRPAWQKGGDTGPVILPRNPKESLLVKSIKHEVAESEMPKKRPKLSDRVIQDFEQWISMGAPDPRDEPDSASSTPSTQETWKQILEDRRRWWSLQPVSQPKVPAVLGETSSRHPIDRFLFAKLKEMGVPPPSLADKRTLLRRLSLVLIGLPPSRQEMEDFLKDTDPHAFERQVERLLASSEFGEHWARKWMDLVRYAETHGSETDPEIRDAWRYRDYLIRAFNRDVRWNQLIQEHVAGDLMRRPRWSDDGQFNESCIGPAHFRLNEHGFQPVDTLEEQVRVVENQIDVLGKAFQGLTIACARCHDHKFDAISQRDYYALYGILASTGPAQVRVDSSRILLAQEKKLLSLKSRIRALLSRQWLEEAQTLESRVADFLNRETKAQDSKASSAESGLNSEQDALWKKGIQEWRQLSASLFTSTASGNSTSNVSFGDPGSTWRVTDEGKNAWYHHAQEKQVSAGDFVVSLEGPEAVSSVLGEGIYSHSVSSKRAGHLTSPRFKVKSNFISFYGAGENGAVVRLIVDNYPLGNNSTFPRKEINQKQPGWLRMNASYRKESWGYLEIVTADDVTRKGDKDSKNGRSWFGIERIHFHDGLNLPDSLTRSNAPPALAKQDPAKPLLEKQIVERTIRFWRSGKMDESEAVFLDFLLRHQFLSNRAGNEELQKLLSEYRRLESEIPIPRRVPGVVESSGFDSSLMIRGDPKKAGPLIPRGYLEVLGDPFPHSESSGRLTLARQLVDSRNPLTARVMVNRIWQHVFGEGIVPTVDNFGRIGEKPTHPELLDYLAHHFVKEGWSLKKSLRFMVMSQSFQASSEPSALALEKDPSNRWYSRHHVRRLQSEAVRDTLLAVSGRLDRTLFGPPQKETSSARRSIYLSVRRTELNPFLQIFDAPKPFTTLGKRDSTVVPAQSLALMNDPFVVEAARHWVGRIFENERDLNSLSAEQRMTRMFEEALNRPPSARELELGLRHLEALSSQVVVGGKEDSRLLKAWQGFAQSLINLKEFLYIP